MATIDQSTVVDAGHTVTDLLNAWSAGDPDAPAAALPLVYRELRAIAAVYCRKERPELTLQPTDLVHEAYLAIFGAVGIVYEDRKHFLNVTGRVMRRILVDHSRRHDAIKRGGDRRRVPIEDILTAPRQSPETVLSVDTALRQLEAIDARDARIVELRFFVGLSRVEIARALDISTKTVTRRWQRVRAWLYGRLADDLATRSSGGET